MSGWHRTLLGMGIRNRQRRAAKARSAEQQRRRSRTRRREDVRAASSAAAPPTELVTAAMLGAADAYLEGDQAAAQDCAEYLVSVFGGRPAVLDVAVLPAVERMLTAVWHGGWLPSDVHQMAQRHREPAAVSYLVDAIAAEARRYPAARVHDRWRDQLGQIGATIWWTSERSHLEQWARRHDGELTDGLRAAVQLLALLRSLPALPRILPLPGTARCSSTVAHRGVDQRVLSRVRALLAKAESTGFAEEAEALSAKAQELMTRHALERVVVEAGEDDEPDPATARRLWLDSPYLDAKALLVDAVASANRCRAVFSAKLGFVTVLGDHVDLEIVELLATSLLVQATRAMLAGGSQVNRHGHSRTRSYRQSFLVAYASRIRERLSNATDEVTSDTAAEAGEDSRLLPVLAARQRVVDELFEEMFPGLVHKPIAASNADGWRAGRAAADLAVLETRRSVAAGG